MKYCRGALETAMTPVVTGCSISTQRVAPYRQALSNLREQLMRYGFEILCEFRVDSALEREMGLSRVHLGVPWRAWQSWWFGTRQRPVMP